MDIPVLSYNMSVFSAKNKVPDYKVPGFASESRFLAPREGVNTKEFFTNAVEHLSLNVSGLGAQVIGIQEFEPATLGQILAIFDKNFAYHVFTKEIKNEAKVLIIWNKTLLGDIVKEKIYDADLPDVDPGVVEGVTLGEGDKGRPISIIITTKGYILMNFHGINRPKYNKDTGAETGVNISGMLKALIPLHAEKAGIMRMNLDKLIIMCDSNDREHGINKESPIHIDTKSFHDGHNAADKTAKSCCYNYDSCGISVAGGPGTMGPSGAEANYAYTGDYVLATNFKQSVIAIPSPLDSQGASIASDHKLVYAVVTVPAAGGGRRRSKSRRQSRKVRRQKQRQSRRRR